MMEETVVDTMSTLIFVLIVDVISMRLALQVDSPWLVMVSAMMRRTMLSPIMMLETAVDSMPTIFVQNVTVNVSPIISTTHISSKGAISLLKNQNSVTERGKTNNLSDLERYCNIGED